MTFSRPRTNRPVCRSPKPSLDALPDTQTRPPSAKGLIRPHSEPLGAVALRRSPMDLTRQQAEMQQLQTRMEAENLLYTNLRKALKRAIDDFDNVWSLRQRVNDPHPLNEAAAQELITALQAGIPSIFFAAGKPKPLVEEPPKIEEKVKTPTKAKEESPSKEKAQEVEELGALVQDSVFQKDEEKPEVPSPSPNRPRANRRRLRFDSSTLRYQDREEDSSFV
ncbi:hypothetical protein L596_016964 [Steinernema carpocapsae]|uniref:Uncharacterized protein n=1 Tax=Steinernema carpocapsae TaxID=34508 RepID=A0A4U5N089_STECR|nr:hypothetical protein L596_016964 [Steinernema carpocapsae]